MEATAKTSAYFYIVAVVSLFFALIEPGKMKEKDACLAQKCEFQ